MYKAIILPLAKLDISETASWYNSKQKGLGKRFTNEVRSKVLFIRKNPKAVTVRYDDTRCAVLDVFPFMITLLMMLTKPLLLLPFFILRLILIGG